MACAHDHAGLGRTHYTQGVGTAQATNNLLCRLKQRLARSEFVRQQVGDHFSIGFRSERVTAALQRLFNLLVVFDNAVMHHGDVIAAVVRMGIGLGGFAVGGPARVRDTAVAWQRGGVQLFSECRDFAQSPVTR